MRVSPCCRQSSRSLLLVFAVYTITFGVLLPPLCRNFRHSIYNTDLVSRRKEVMRATEENSHRLKQSKDVIEQFAMMPQATRALVSASPEIGITVVTVSRKHLARKHYPTEYLTQVVGRMLQLFTTAKHLRKSYALFLCNVDNDPELYDEIQPLAKLFPTFQRFKYEHNEDIDIFEKEKLDYIFCLEETLKRNVSYVFMVEDDAYPREELLPVLEHVLDTRVENNPLVSFTHNVTYLKLYHPDRLLGYINLEWERLPELISIGLVFGTPLFVLYMYCFSDWKMARFGRVWFHCGLYCSLIALAIGRVHILELRRFSTQLYQVTPAPSCCTQAMLFPQQGARDVATKLKEETCDSFNGKDQALNNICQRDGCTALHVQPNLFEHIGHLSSLREGVFDIFI